MIYFLSFFLFGLAEQFQVEKISLKYAPLPEIQEVVGKDANMPLLNRRNKEGSIVVSLYSQLDLLDVRKKLRVPLLVNINFCEASNHEDRVMGLFEIYSSGQSLTELSNINKKNLTKKNNLFKYNVIIFIRQDIKKKIPTSQKAKSVQKYDTQYNLKEKAQDICLQIESADMLFNRFRTKPIRISKSIIEAVLDNKH